MAEVARSDSSSPDTDRDFDPSADMMVHEYDDERTLDEEEAMTSGESCAGELDDLQKESEMPLQELLAQYAAGNASPEDMPDNSKSNSSSSSEEEILESQNLTLDKEIISRDLLNNSGGGEDHDISVNDLIQNVSRSHTERLLRSTSHAGSEESESSSEDENYEVIEEHKKTIQVGSDFQAVIPFGLSTYDDAPAYENEDRLLWDPSKIKDETGNSSCCSNPTCSGHSLNDYLCNLQREGDKRLNSVANIPRGRHIRDDEQALFLLLQCDNNIEEAERRRKMQAVPPTDVMSLWSEDECRNFEDGLRLYGKNFHEIHHNKVRTRSVFELVHFYYLWKKTERHDVFAAKTRAEKRKYSINPGVMDHMDRFLEEQEVELSQAMIPHASDIKLLESPDIESKLHEDIFNTGKTTILSPTRLMDRSPLKPEQAASKRNFSSICEINGSGTNAGHAGSDFSSRKQKSDDAHEPPVKKNKIEDSISPDRNAKLVSRSGSPLPPSLPPPSLCEATTHPESAAETGNEQVYVNSSVNDKLDIVPSNSKIVPENIKPDTKSTDVGSIQKDSLCLPSVNLSSSTLSSSKSVTGAGDARASDHCLGSEVSAM